MNDKKIVIIENEKIFEENNSFYCDNIDAKSIPEGINKFKKTSVIARKSKTNRVQKINLNEIKTGSNIFTFLKESILTIILRITSFLIEQDCRLVLYIDRLLPKPFVHYRL